MEQRDDKEKREQQTNRAASENMNKNDERQAEKQRTHQDNLTRSAEPEEDASSLINNSDGTDALPISERNRKKQEDDENRDFGSEQI